MKLLLIKASKDITKKITELWSFIGILLGAITAIVEFIQLLKGNQETIIQVLGFCSLLLIWISLYHVGFAKTKSPALIKNRFGEDITREIYEYGDLSKIFRYLFFISLLGGVVLAGLAIRQSNRLRDSVVVLIANFYGPDIENYQVTQILLNQLSASLSSYEDTEIIALNKTISEQDGSPYAQSLGEQYQADLVIWGWYGVTDSDVLMTVHVENLSYTNYLFVPASSSYGTQLPALEIKNFTIQEILSSEMTGLVLFLGGITRFEANDYEEAINRLSQALGEQSPNKITSKAFIHYYRGLSYFYSLHDDETYLQNSINDFSETLKMIPAFVQANYQRALGYYILNDYENAKMDYEIVIDKKNIESFTYEELACVSMIVHEVEDAINYLSLAIENKPKDYILRYNRGILYLPQGEYTKSIKDLTQVIALAPEFWIGYAARAETYIAMEEYTKAIQDIDHALSLMSANERENFGYSYYYQRGYAYLQIDEYEKAIEDITLSLQDDYNFYGENLIYTPKKFYSRGIAFEKTGNIQEALMDYSYSAQAYAYSSQAWYVNQGYGYDDLNTMCDMAANTFQELSKNSQDTSVSRFANAVKESFQENCPDSLSTRFLIKIPEETWTIRFANNPIVPNIGLAGISIGDSTQFVREQLDEPITWFQLTNSNNDDCCIVAAWVSADNLDLMIFFTISDEKVVYLNIRGNGSHSSYTPFINDIFIGASEKDLLDKWGEANVFERAKDDTNYCYHYAGIEFCFSEEDEKIHSIWIPSYVE